MNSTKEIKQHWEDIYTQTNVEETGWYEKHPTPSLDLIDTCDLSNDDHILDVGSGASTLIDELAERGYRNITAVDVSEKALHELQNRLKAKGLTDPVECMVDDITAPTHLQTLDPVSLWHDRALLHFLQTKQERNKYAKMARKLIKPGGYAVIAEFSPDGVDRCSGIEVRKYDAADISGLLGPDFELQKQFDYLYTTPSGGERPYIYTLFKRA